MKKLVLLSLLVLLACQPFRVLAQQPSGPAYSYMQIFFEGPNWLAGREVLHYSPAFKGKTGEVVAETEATRRLSPGEFLNGPASGAGTTATATSATMISEVVEVSEKTYTAKGAFVRGKDGKMRPQTADDVRKEQQEERASFNNVVALLEQRANLARTALSKALNEAAADGWEVVQMTAYGSQGGLVYLLRRR